MYRLLYTLFLKDLGCSVELPTSVVLIFLDNQNGHCAYLGEKLPTFPNQSIQFNSQIFKSI